jgi:hypothetical protein
VRRGHDGQHTNKDNSNLVVWDEEAQSQTLLRLRCFQLQPKYRMKAQQAYSALHTRVSTQPPDVPLLPMFYQGTHAAQFRPTKGESELKRATCQRTRTTKTTNRTLPFVWLDTSASPRHSQAAGVWSNVQVLKASSKSAPVQRRTRGELGEEGHRGEGGSGHREDSLTCSFIPLQKTLTYRSPCCDLRRVVELGRVVVLHLGIGHRHSVHGSHRAARHHGQTTARKLRKSQNSKSKNHVDLTKSFLDLT